MKDESIDVMSQNFQSTTLLLCRAMDYYVYLVLAKTFKVGDRVALLGKEFTAHAAAAVGEDVVLLSDLQQVKTRRICPETSQQQVDFTVKMTRRQNSLADVQYRALSVGRSAIVASDMKVRLEVRAAFLHGRLVG